MATGDSVGGCFEQTAILLSLDASPHGTDLEIQCHGTITRKRECGEHTNLQAPPAPWERQNMDIKTRRLLTDNR